MGFNKAIRNKAFCSVLKCIDSDLNVYNTQEKQHQVLADLIEEHNLCNPNIGPGRRTCMFDTKSLGIALRSACSRNIEEEYKTQQNKLDCLFQYGSIVLKPSYLKQLGYVKQSDVPVNPIPIAFSERAPSGKDEEHTSQKKASASETPDQSMEKVIKSKKRTAYDEDSDWQASDEDEEWQASDEDAEWQPRNHKSKSTVKRQKSTPANARDKVQSATPSAPRSIKFVKQHTVPDRLVKSVPKLQNSSSMDDDTVATISRTASKDVTTTQRHTPEKHSDAKSAVDASPTLSASQVQQFRQRDHGIDISDRQARIHRQLQIGISDGTIATAMNDIKSCADSACSCFFPYSAPETSGPGTVQLMPSEELGHLYQFIFNGKIWKEEVVRLSQPGLMRPCDTLLALLGAVLQLYVFEKDVPWSHYRDILATTGHKLKFMPLDMFGGFQTEYSQSAGAPDTNFDYFLRAADLCQLADEGFRTTVINVKAKEIAANATLILEPHLNRLESHLDMREKGQYHIPSSQWMTSVTCMVKHALLLKAGLTFIYEEYSFLWFTGGEPLRHQEMNELYKWVIALFPGLARIAQGTRQTVTKAVVITRPPKT